MYEYFHFEEILKGHGTRAVYVYIGNDKYYVTTVHPNIEEQFNVIDKEHAYPIYNKDESEILGWKDESGNDTDVYENFHVYCTEKFRDKLVGILRLIMEEIIEYEDADDDTIKEIEEIIDDDDMVYEYGLEMWGYNTNERGLCYD